MSHKWLDKITEKYNMIEKYRNEKNMDTYSIIIDPNPILRVKCSPVVCDEIKTIKHSMAPKMIKTVRKNDGIGLAANQVGISWRFFVMLREQKNVPQVVINPEIISMSNKEEWIEVEDGCLSIPNKRIKIQRPVAIEVKYTNLFCKEVKENLIYMDAFVFLHELDHLNGKLITDYEGENKNEN